MMMIGDHDVPTFTIAYICSLFAFAAGFVAAEITRIRGCRGVRKGDDR